MVIFSLLFTGMANAQNVSELTPASSVLKPNDRIVFIGDSITMQGIRGWCKTLDKALTQQRPELKQNVSAIASSGHTVGSWINAEKQSRVKPVIWKIPQPLDVGKELDKKADVLVIMLGMNDVLAPRVIDNEKGYAKWKENYRQLIRALRKRCEPRIMGLATPTPCTEAPDSPKNQVMDRLVKEIKTLAKEEKCFVLPTRETAWEVLEKIRRINPKGHITGDQVHPNSDGHLAIAAGMLRGLGEKTAAAKLLAAKRFVPASDNLSYSISPVNQALPQEKLSYILKVFHSGEKITFNLPKGWSMKELKTGKDTNQYKITGTPNHLINTITIKSGKKTLEIQIPAPWLIATVHFNRLGWTGVKFNPTKGKLPVDEYFRTGKGFPAKISNMEAKPGKKLTWKVLTGGIDYGSAGSPNAIDFAGVDYFESGQVGYGMRWIYSGKELNAKLKIRVPGHGCSHLEVWFNGKTKYTGNPTKADKTGYPVTLKKGWNLLSFKSNYLFSKWQVQLGLVGNNGQSLDTLRYSVVPRIIN